jgi:peroxin-10
MVLRQEQVTLESPVPFTDFIYYSTATQTLGEEYTHIWQYSPHTQTLPLSSFTRTTLIILSLVPSYFIERLGQNVSLNNRHPNLTKCLKRLHPALDIATEINLAVFYLRGNYYDFVKRVLGIHYVRSSPHRYSSIYLTFPRYPLFRKIHIHDLRLTHYLGS